MKKLCSKLFVISAIFLLAACSNGRGRGGRGNQSRSKGTEIQDVQQKKVVVSNAANHTVEYLESDLKVEASAKLSGTFFEQRENYLVSLSFNNVGLNATLLADFPDAINSQADINQIRASLHSQTSGTITGKAFGADVSFDCQGNFLDGYFYQNKVYFQIFDNSYISLASAIEGGNIKIGKFFVDEDILIFDDLNADSAGGRLSDAFAEIYESLNEFVDQGYLRVYETDDTYTFDLDYLLAKEGYRLEASYTMDKNYRPMELSCTFRVQQSRNTSNYQGSIDLKVEASAKISYVDNPQIIFPTDLLTYEAM